MDRRKRTALSLAALVVASAVVAVVNAQILRGASSPVLRGDEFPSTSATVDAVPSIAPSPSAPVKPSTGISTPAPATSKSPKAQHTPIKKKRLAAAQVDLLRVSALARVSPIVAREAARGSTSTSSLQREAVRSAAEQIGVPLQTIAQVQQLPEADELGPGSDEVVEDNESAHTHDRDDKTKKSSPMSVTASVSE